MPTITITYPCNPIAGTMRYAQLTPGIPPSAFPVRHSDTIVKSADKPTMNTSRRRSNDVPKVLDMTNMPTDDFDDDLKDEDLIAAGIEQPLVVVVSY
jgi:hypothetical protein